MRFPDFVVAIRSPFASGLLLLSAVTLWAGPGSAANAIVKDGNTIQLADAAYRLAGIDAPELDQTCIDDQADPWGCGVDARDQLAKLVGGHVVRCEDRGPDPAYKKRHLGICTVAGETTSLNQALVRLGFAIIPARPVAVLPTTRPRREATARGYGRAASSRRRISGSARRTARCSAAPARPTRTRKSAASCSRNSCPCRPVAPSRRNSRCAPASPAMSASIICRDAAAIRRLPDRTAGSAPRTTPAPRDFAGRIIAGRGSS